MAQHHSRPKPQKIRILQQLILILYHIIRRVILPLHPNILKLHLIGRQRPRLIREHILHISQLLNNRSGQHLRIPPLMIEHIRHLQIRPNEIPLRSLQNLHRDVHRDRDQKRQQQERGQRYQGGVFGD